MRFDLDARLRRCILNVTRQPHNAPVHSASKSVLNSPTQPAGGLEVPGAVLGVVKHPVHKVSELSRVICSKGLECPSAVGRQQPLKGWEGGSTVANATASGSTEGLAG